MTTEKKCCAYCDERFDPEDSKTCSKFDCLCHQSQGEKNHIADADKMVRSQRDDWEKRYDEEVSSKYADKVLRWGMDINLDIKDFIRQELEKKYQRGKRDGILEEGAGCHDHCEKARMEGRREAINYLIAHSHFVISEKSVQISCDRKTLDIAVQDTTTPLT